VSKPSRNNRRHVPLFTLGVSTIKGSLYSRLRIERPGPGYCHFPIEAKTNHRGYDSPYFKGLVSERMVVKRVRGKERIEWEPRSAGIRNEPLDVRVYATGALEILNPDLERRRERHTVKKQKNRKTYVKNTSKEPHERQLTEENAEQTTVPEPKKQPVKRPALQKRHFRVVGRGVSL
jgi:phage terminase large subunit GpA-like protein